LRGCKIEDNKQGLEDSFVLVASNKSYIISADNSETLQEHKKHIISWRNAIEYTIKNADTFKDQALEGKLWKKGSKGASFNTWKHYSFSLRGNLITFYSSKTENKGKAHGIKGVIDLEEITELSSEPDPEDRCNKPNYFKLVVNNEKEHYIASSGPEEKEIWVNAIQSQLDLIEEKSVPMLGSSKIEEVLVTTGYLMRQKSQSSWKRNWVVLTNLNLRFYYGRKNKVESHFGKGLISCLYLIGTSVQRVPQKTPFSKSSPVLKITDRRGSTYTLAVKSGSISDWYHKIKKTTESLISNIIEKGGTISFNTYSVDGENLGYTGLKFNSTRIAMFFLGTKKEVNVPIYKIKSISMERDLVVLKYEEKENGKQEKKFKSGNADGFYFSVKAALDCAGKAIEEKHKLFRTRSLLIVTGDKDGSPSTWKDSSIGAKTRQHRQPHHRVSRSTSSQRSHAPNTLRGEILPPPSSMSRESLRRFTEADASLNKKPAIEPSSQSLTKIPRNEDEMEFFISPLGRGQIFREIETPRSLNQASTNAETGLSSGEQIGVGTDNKEVLIEGYEKGLDTEGKQGNTENDNKPNNPRKQDDAQDKVDSPAHARSRQRHLNSKKVGARTNVPQNAVPIPERRMTVGDEATAAYARAGHLVTLKTPGQFPEIKENETVGDELTFPVPIRPKKQRRQKKF